MNRLDAITHAPADTRLLGGAVLSLLGLTLISALQVGAGDLSWRTPIGLVSPIDLAGVFVAMLLGGYIARQRRFRWLAPLLQLVIAVCTLAAYLVFDTGMHDAMRVPATLLRLNAAPLLLGLGLAFAGALAGERWAARGAGAAPDAA